MKSKFQFSEQKSEAIGFAFLLIATEIFIEGVAQNSRESIANLAKCQYLCGMKRTSLI